MKKLLAWFALKFRAIQEYLTKTFRRRRSPMASITSTARAALSALSSQYTGYAGGDEEPIGIVRGTKVPFGFDLEMMMYKGVIEAMVVVVLGKLNSRKTTLIKNMLIVRMRTSFGGRRSRAIVEDVIVRNGVPEWRKMAEKMRVKPINMHEPFNPLSIEYGMTRDEHMITVEDLITAGGFKRPTGKHDQAARIAFLKMYSQYPEEASMKTYNLTLKKLKSEDVVAYGKQIDDEYKARVEAKYAAEGKEIPKALRELMNRESNVDPQEIVNAALEVHYDLDKVLEGPLGRMFSGTETHVEGFRQRLVVLNYTELLTNPSAIALIKRFIRRLMASAKNRNDLRFMFQTDISDEAYKMLRIGDEAVETSDDVKSVRSTNKAKFILSQRARDFESIGEGDSLKRNASTNLFGDVSVFFIGRQGKKDIARLQLEIDLSDEEVAIIMTQAPGQFLVKIGDNPGIPIDTNPLYTASLAEVSESNLALFEALQRQADREDTFVEEEFDFTEWEKDFHTYQVKEQNKEQELVQAWGPPQSSSPENTPID